MADTALLARRLANFRAARATERVAEQPPAPQRRSRTRELAAKLADALDGQAVATPHGTVVRLESPARPVAIDRAALARLPGQPPADAPLVCLDTETTGLGTAAGTVAFLVGLGWWEGQRFRQVQLLLPDHSEEVALLEMLATLIPAHAWLVTYNGRGFDWPLLVTRFRMAGRDAPPHAGHLDLLTVVRRLFRHRMTDARLRTAEDALLGMGRADDVEGWEIPGRYLTFLRGGNPAGLLPVVDHNDHDVRSLARLLVHLADELGDDDRRRAASDGDLLGLARSYQREQRPLEAMACLDLALSRPPLTSLHARRSGSRVPPAWLVDRSDGIASAIAELSAARDARLTRDQIARERARLLRRLGNPGDARRAWRELAARGGPLAALALVELAKLLEHVERDFAGALAAVAEAETLADRSWRVGQPLPLGESDLARRRARLLRRAEAATPRDAPAGSLRVRADVGRDGPPAHATVAHALANR